jgi:hypothetical protein
LRDWTNPAESFVFEWRARKADTDYDSDADTDESGGSGGFL